MFRADLSSRRERLFAVASIVVLAVETAVASVLYGSGRRFDAAFFAARDIRRVMTAVEHPVAVGTEIQVSPNGVPSQHIALLEGWSELEPGGVWTDAEAAQIAVQLPSRRARNLRISLSGIALAPSKRLQNITVTAGQAVLGRWKLASGPSILTAPLPEMGNRTLYLTLLIGHPVRSPDDQRKLGFFLGSMKIMSSRSGVLVLPLPNPASKAQAD